MGPVVVVRALQVFPLEVLLVDAQRVRVVRGQVNYRRELRTPYMGIDLRHEITV